MMHAIIAKGIGSMLLTVSPTIHAGMQAINKKI
jgi:hypothetical protein